MSLRVNSLVLSGAFVALVACSHDSSFSSTTATASTAARPSVELLFYAATSARDALQALASTYSKDHQLEITFNFGSSGDLSKQIVAANKADLFLSADEKEMDKVAAAGLVDEGTRHDLLGNQLAVIEPIDPKNTAATVFTQPFTASQLAGDAVERLSLGNVETVPAGRYGKAWLEKQGVWDQVAPKVLPGVDVRAALGAVESGAAQAGIVYRTDVARSQKARVAFAVPIAEGPKITYPICVLKARPNGAAARELATFLQSAPAKTVFESYGFLSAPTATPAK